MIYSRKIKYNKTQFNNFINYVLDFYNPAYGMYPMQDLTRDDVELATLVVLGKRTLMNEEFTGDSFDREAVRDILIDELMFQIKD